MTEIPEGYKRCSKCGEIKPISEFYKDKTKRDGKRSWCKICMKWQYDTHKEEYRKKGIKYNKCVKNPACPFVGGKGAEFVILTCPICGKEFRRRKSEVDNNYERRGQTVYFCSRECWYASQRKLHKTEYEKNIKRIRKGQRL